jgi:hypothetical protein
VGGAFGVAVIGSLMSTRYQHRLMAALTAHHLPAAVGHSASASLGAALAVAQRLGEGPGTAVAQSARSAFVSGMDLGLRVAALLAVVGAVLALLALPSRLGRDNPERRADPRGGYGVPGGSVHDPGARA